jgi:hypothetical protein
MKNRSSSQHAAIKTLLRLPRQAKPGDVYAFVVGCLGDGLACRLEPVARLSVQPPRYRAAWHCPKGRRYEGEGRSVREATLAAAARFISQSEEAVLLRGWDEEDGAAVPCR